MKIIFFGTPRYAEIVLNYLIDEPIEIVAIVTKPDKPKGRSKKLVAPPVKSCGERRLPNVPIYQPKRASTPEFADILKNHAADLFVVVAYGEIIKQFLLDIPPLGCINVHFSQLPRWRGAAPMQHTLLAGDEKTGVSIIEMVLALDAGDILGVKQIDVPQEMRLDELGQKLCEIAGPLLVDVINSLSQRRAAPKPQDETLVTLAPKITVEDCIIDWNQSANAIHNQIRALAPAPGAFCKVLVRGEEKKLKILRSKPSLEKDWIYKKGMWIKPCKEGSLQIFEVQLEGKKAMDVQSFMQGNQSIEILS